MKKYRVKNGEDLGMIARKYAIPSWKYIYEINKKVIGDNPDLLKEGTILEIPQWDTTSGDEKIIERDADPFEFTGGLRYAYPWVPLSLSLTNWDLSGVELKEPVEVIIRDRKHNTELWKGTISKFDELNVLVPDSQDVNIGIKGYPTLIGNSLHIHPGDEKEQKTTKVDHKTEDSPIDENGLLSSLGIKK